jgi:hypothetical protein
MAAVVAGNCPKQLFLATPTLLPMALLVTVTGIVIEQEHNAIAAAPSNAFLSDFIADSIF